jgi:small subunit ribosomal protein S17
MKAKNTQDEKNPADCNDKNCPLHGTLSLRGRAFVGKVISAKSAKTVTVEWERQKFLRKYERYEKRRTRVKAHSPLCLNAKEGNYVKIKECRPISKTKKFTVVEIIDQK